MGLGTAAVRASVVLLVTSTGGGGEGGDGPALAARAAYLWGARVAPGGTEATHLDGRISVYSRRQPTPARVVAVARAVGARRVGR